MDALGIQQVRLGHWLLALCAVLYLAWWCVFFRPRDEKPQGVERGAGIALILGAVVAGLAAVFQIVTGLGQLPDAFSGPVLWLVAAGTYALLAFVTSRFLERPVTTELLLIVAWCALEVDVAGAVWPNWPLLVAVIVATAFSMVCYLLYYRLEGRAAFLDGCGPLVAVGLLSVIVAWML